MDSPEPIDFELIVADKNRPDPAARYTGWTALGAGQFGTVYRALDTIENRDVAIKRIKLGDMAEAKEGIHRTAIREIKILQEMSHENIVKLFHVFTKDTNIHMVLEICGGKDLEVLIQDTRVQLSEADIKSFMLMTCQGLEYLHRHWVLHRDMKPNNLFLTDKGVLKLADFGLGCFHGSPSRKMTHEVCTIFYRAPELLYGARSYGAGIDMWALGCIHAELELRIPFLAGDTDKTIPQLTRIFEALGSCDESSWPGITSLPDYLEIGSGQRDAAGKMIPYPKPVGGLRAYFTAASDHSVAMITGMLECNPSKRMTVTEALKHPYFSSDPKPTRPENLPKVMPKEESKKSRPGKRKLDAEDGGGIGKANGEDQDGPGPAKALRFE